MAKFVYQIVQQGETVVLVMNEATASLVADALAIIRPDTDLAVQVAQQLEIEVRP